jgi:hypothetical protein
MKLISALRGGLVCAGVAAAAAAGAVVVSHADQLLRALTAVTTFLMWMKDT